MVAIRNPKNLRNLNDVTQPGGLGLPDQGVPVLHSSNSSFVIQTIAAGGGGQFSMGASTLGSTLGDTGVTGTRVVLAGIGNITLSQLTDANGGTISISGGTVAAGAAFSAGVSGGNTAGSTGVTGTRLVFAGGQSVTLSQSTDANGGTITISGASTSQSVQTQNMVAVTADGNTAGALALVSSGTLTLAGGNSITLSQNGNAITISGATTSQSVQTQAVQTGISSIVASNTTYTSGSVQFTGSGIVTVRSSANQRVVIDASESVQTQNLHNLTLSGNTAGVMAQVSSGTLTLAGGNNITLSQNGNAVTISGAAAGGAQTAISGIAASNTTYTSGTVTITGVGGGVTVSSNTGQRIDISVAAPVAQTNQAGSLYAIGNTTSSTSGTWDARTLSISGAGIISVAATNSGFKISATQSNDTGGVYAVGNTYSSSSGTFDVRTMSLRGDGIISIAATNSGFRISASQSVQPETQTFLAGLANSQTTYTSGTVSLSELGAITIRSTTGNQYQLSVNAQTTQTQNLHNVTISGNTSGALAAISSGTMTLAGGNNITLSQAGNAITISGANVGGAQTGISGIANSQTTYTSGTVSLSELGAITIRSTTGNQYQFSVNAQTNQAGSIYAIGNTTSSSSGTYDARTLSISGAGIISVAATNSGWKISATQSVQPETQTFVGGIAASNTTYTSGTITITGVGGGVTVSSNTGQRVDISVAAPVAQTNQSGGVYAVGNTYSSSSGTIDARTLSLRGDGIISVAATNSGWRISAAAQTGISSIVASDATYTSGSVQFTGSGIVTVQSSANQRVVIHATESVQTQNLHNVTLSGNTAGAMAQISSGTMTLAGGNGITLSQAGNAVTISGGGGISSDTDVTAITQTTHGFAVGDWVRLSGTTYVKAQADTEANAEVVGVVSAVADANNFTLTTGGLVTGLSGLTAGAVYYLDPATAGAITTTQPSTAGQISKPVLIARSTTSGYVFNMRGNIVPASAITAFLAGMSNIGNTSGDTGITGSRLVLAGGNNITLSQSTNVSGGTVTISAGAGGGFSAGVSTGGNTQGQTGVTGTRLVIVGTNNITLSQATDANGGTISISGQSPAGGAFSGGVSNLGNTAGATGITGTQLVLVGSGAMSLSQTTGANGGTVSINAPATSSLVGVSGISISTNGSTISVMQTTGSGFLTSMAPYDESPIVTGQQGQGSLHLSPLRVPEGLQFDRIGLGVQYSNATNSSGSMTISNWVGLYTRNVSSISLLASTSISTNFTGSGTVGSYSLFAGPRWQTIGWTTTLTEGDYYMGIISRTTSGGANMIASQLLLSKFTNSAWSGMVGVSTSATNQRNLGQGHYSATTSSLPGSIAFSQILGTASDVLRSPIFMFRSGTV